MFPTQNLRTEVHEVHEVHEVLEVHEVYEVLGGMMCVCVKVCYDLFLNPLPPPLLFLENTTMAELV